MTATNSSLTSLQSKVERPGSENFTGAFGVTLKMRLVFLRLTLKTDTEEFLQTQSVRPAFPRWKSKAFPLGSQTGRDSHWSAKLGIPVEAIRRPRVKSTHSWRKRSYISAFAFALCCFFWHKKCVHALSPETWLHCTAQVPLELIVQAGLKSEILFPPNTGMMSVCHCAQVNL